MKCAESHISTKLIKRLMNAMRSKSTTPKEQARIFTREKLKTLSTWTLWHEGETKQLDQFEKLQTGACGARQLRLRFTIALPITLTVSEEVRQHKKRIFWLNASHDWFWFVCFFAKNCCTARTNWANQNQSCDWFWVLSTGCTSLTLYQ